jgi:hypothetical protein
MIDNYFSDRLKDKIKDCLKNKNLENILIEWISIGNEREKLDTYHIIKNLDCIIEKLNIVKFPISAKIIKKNLIKMIHDILESPIYQFNPEISMNHIETRSWLVSCMCLCSIDTEDIKMNVNYLLQCFEENIDDASRLYAIDGIGKCIDPNIPNYFDEVIKFYEQIGICDKNQLKTQEPFEKYQICIMLWFIKYKDENALLSYTELINSYDKKINEMLETDNAFIVSEVLYIYGCMPVECYIDNIINLLEQTLKKEKTKKLIRFNLIYYLNLIRACIGIRYINNELLIKKKEDVAHLLFRFLKVFRNYSDYVWNPMVIKILSCLRKYHQILGTNIIIDNLHHELLHDNHNIVTSACKTLHTFYQINNSTNMILEAASKEVMKLGSSVNSPTIIALSNSLKWMNNKDISVLEALEDRMYRGETENTRTLAQKLISEMGGANAIKKLEVRKMLKDSYSDRISKAQKDVENMFHTTIIDAKRGFNASMIMEILIFLSGLSLIIVSGYMAIFNGAQSSMHWIGTASTGGGGILGIMYSLFISKPREKVKENVTHLMFLKIIFLGYLRELNQVDQCFNHYILDEKSTISPEHISIFNGNIDTIMTHCLQLLTMMNSESNAYLDLSFKNNSDKNNNNVFNNNSNHSTFNDGNRNEQSYYQVPLSQIPSTSLSPSSRVSSYSISQNNSNPNLNASNQLVKTKSKKNMREPSTFSNFELSSFMNNKYINNIEETTNQSPIKIKQSTEMYNIDPKGLIEMGCLKDGAGATNKLTKTI